MTKICVIESDCCVTPHERYFSYIKTRTIYIRCDDSTVRFVLDHHAQLDFLQCQFTETTVRGMTIPSTRAYYPDSGPTSLCYFSLMLRTLQWRSSTYQYYSFMFCTSLFVLLYFFILSLCCLSFDLRLLITPLVSSNLFLDFLVLSDRGSNPQYITLKVSMLTTYPTDTVRLV